MTIVSICPGGDANAHYRGVIPSSYRAPGYFAQQVGNRRGLDLQLKFQPTAGTIECTAPLLLDRDNTFPIKIMDSVEYGMGPAGLITAWNLSEMAIPLLGLSIHRLAAFAQRLHPRSQARLASLRGHSVRER